MRLGLHARRLLEEIFQGSCLGYPTFTIRQRIRTEPCSNKVRGNSRIRAAKKLQRVGLVEILDHQRVTIGLKTSVIHVIEVKLTKYGDEYCGARIKID